MRKDALALAENEPFTHVIELLPLAILFRRGQRIRLSLAAADVDHFVTPPLPPLLTAARITWRIDRGASRLLLPTRAR